MRIFRSKKLELQHLWVITVIIGVFVFVNTQPIRPNDFWWHMAIGREIIVTNNIPIVDEYSFTMGGELYPSYQMFWLSEVALYQIYSLGGAALVIFIHSLIITAAYALLLLLCRKISNSWRIASLATLFAVALGLFNWAVRPQTISYLLGVLFLLAIFSFRRSQKYRWLLIFPLGMLVWVNSHGSFIIGLLLIGLWLGDEVWNIFFAKFKQEEDLSVKNFWVALLTLGVTLLVCLINPRGFGIVDYVLSLTGNPVVQNLVPEWAPPTFDTDYGRVFLIGFLLSSLVLALSAKRPNFYQTATFITFAILGLMTTRGVIWFGIVMAPVLADLFPSVISRPSTDQAERPSRLGKKWINITILSLVVLIALISLPWFKEYLPFPQKKVGLVFQETPVEATEFLLSEQPPGELFNDMGYGSYLIWAAQPDYRVFIDPRIELYPSEIWLDYVALINALPGWEELLEEYKIHTLMLNPNSQEPLIDVLEASSSWSLIFSDHSTVIYTSSGME
jgi:hypothetical protein